MAIVRAMAKAIGCPMARAVAKTVAVAMAIVSTIAGAMAKFEINSYYGNSTIKC